MAGLAGIEWELYAENVVYKYSVDLGISTFEVHLGTAYSGASSLVVGWYVVWRCSCIFTPPSPSPSLSVMGPYAVEE